MYGGGSGYQRAPDSSHRSSGHKMANNQDLMLVNTEVAKLVEAMEPRHVALLIAAIQNPDDPLIELSNRLWPELGYDRRKQIIAASNVSKVINLVKTRPFAMAALMSTKLAPVMVAVLFELAQTAGKENVRATAARELLRMAQVNHTKLIPSDEEPEPTEELDKLLESGAEQTFEGEAHQVDGGGAEPLTEAELIA